MLGKFITFEGGDGAGKSTQIQLLAQYLETKGIEYIITREPGGGKMSEEIRQLLLNKKDTNCVNDCEALLIAAARVQHVHDIILPSLKANKVILCDRYVHSTFAYQGYGRGMDLDFLKAINMPAMEQVMPDITFLLHIHPSDAFARKNKRVALDRIEQAGIAFHERVYNGYLKLAKEDEKIISIDANLPVSSIHASILQALKI